MPHAQIELYPERQMTEEESSDPEQRAAYYAETKWGWRKQVYVEPPETVEDSGTIYPDRQTAFDAAFAKYPHWPIG